MTRAATSGRPRGASGGTRCSASDLVRVSPDGEVVDGSWDVSPAIFLHTGLHRRRPDARVVVHNHPYHATLLATMGRLPEITHQAACMFDGALALVDEYEGQVLDADAGEWLADEVGDADGDRPRQPRRDRHRHRRSRRRRTARTRSTGCAGSPPTPSSPA